MPAPWQKYGASKSAAAPWTKYSGATAAEVAPAAPSKPAGSMSSFASPYAAYDPTFRKATGTDYDASTRSVGGGVANFLMAAQEDPGAVATAGAAGVNKGVASLVGVPMDFATNVTDLLGAGYGLGMHAITGRPAGEFFEPYDRSQIPLTGDWNANKLDQGATALGGSPATQNPAPNNLAARLAYSAGTGVPGAMTGRAMVAGAAGGGASGLVAEAGGGPGVQAIAGLAGGRAAERVPSPRRAPVTDPMTPSFGRDSASAAAAMPPQLEKVPPAMRGPLVIAMMRGDREMVQAVLEAETLPVPLKLTEGMARGDAKMISDEQNMRAVPGSGIPERMKELNEGLIDNLDEVRRQVSPNVVGNDHIQNGQALIDAYKAYDEPVRAEISAKYKALEDANGGALPLRAGDFVKAAEAQLAAKFKAKRLPADIRADLDSIRDQADLMTFQQFEEMRTSLAKDARKAEAANDGNAAAAINIVRKALEDMPMGEEGSKLKALADDARAAARKRFEALDADPAYRAAVDDDTPTGELSSFADDFVKKYVVNGKAANIQRMQDKLAADPVARETIAAAALNYVKSKSGVNLYTNEGNFSQAGFNRALAEITPRLKQLVPGEVADVLQQLGNVARRIQQRPSGSYVNSSNTYTAAVGKAAKNYTENALNTVVPGVNLGTTIRRQRAEGRDKKRASRALNPLEYLSASADK